MSSIRVLLDRSWSYFLVFSVTIAILSYNTFSLSVTFGIGFLGLALPFGLNLWLSPSSSEPQKPLYEIEIFEKIPFWIWLLVGALALFLRFDQLTTLSGWPNFDESLYGFTAIQTMKTGIEHPFYFYGHATFFYPWLLSWVFGRFGISLSTLWSLPALVSALCVPLVYIAARNYFSRSFSFFCTLVTALSFWPCFSGRFSEPGVFILPLGIFILFFLGKCHRSEGPKGDWEALWLGLATGLSFYITSIGQISTAVVVGATMTVLFWKDRPKRLLLFGAALILSSLPLILLFLRTEGTDSYLSSQWTIGASMSWLEKLRSAWSTPKNIFFGALNDGVWYKPVWGGLIDPILGALSGLGMLEILKKRDRALYRWLGMVFIVLLLPGILGQSFEFYRVIPVLLVLIPIIGLGWARLNQDLSPRWSVAALWLLMITSVGLDARQLLDVYPHLWNRPAYWLSEIKSINQYRAFQILRSKSQVDGPGLIFSDFVPGYEDQSLRIADDGFNAVNNDQLDWQKAKWAALVINVNYQPFLAKELGRGKVYWLSKDLNYSDGGWMLWVLDITDSNRARFGKWREASRSLNDYIYAYFLEQNFKNPTQMADAPYLKVMDTLNGTYPFFKDDPFLEAFYAEKKADLCYKGRRFNDAVQALEQGTQKGWPAANLFYRLGTMEMIQNHVTESRKAFKKAVRAPINLTRSAQFVN